MGDVLVSIVIPCRNEADFIEQTINSLLRQENVGGRIEILIVDGMSNDGTRDILKKLTETYPQVKFLDNPKLITPAAMNIGIKAASGEYICIMGAHSEYMPEYIAMCLELFKKHPEISCAGGPIISKGKNNFGKAAALAMSSTIGVGNAKHRFPDYEGYAEMACFPMFKRSVFDEIGYYDERLIRNQDDEFCFRLRRNGGKIYISPEIKSEYYVRDSPSKLFKQYYDYGRWRLAVLKKHKLPIALRQFIPALFFLSTILLLLAGWLSGSILFALILPLLYILIITMASAAVTSKNGIEVGKNFPYAVFILHFSYAAGFTAGLFNNPLKSRGTE